MLLRALISATLLFFLALTPRPSLAAAFDAEFAPDQETQQYMGVEKPIPARDFIDNVAIYVRWGPKKGNRVFPVFINTKNYLQCPDSDQKWFLTKATNVAYDKRSGVAVVGFFFDKPPCEKPTFHMHATVADPSVVPD